MTAAANGYQQRLAAAHNARTIRAYAAQLSGLRQWADTVLRQHYSGYELRDCRPSHIHAIWELSHPDGHMAGFVSAASGRNANLEKFEPLGPDPARLAWRRADPCRV